MLESKIGHRVTQTTAKSIRIRGETKGKNALAYTYSVIPRVGGESGDAEEIRTDSDGLLV